MSKKKGDRKTMDIMSRWNRIWGCLVKRKKKSAKGDGKFVRIPSGKKFNGESTCGPVSVDGLL